MGILSSGYQTLIEIGPLFDSLDHCLGVVVGITTLCFFIITERRKRTKANDK